MGSQQRETPAGMGVLLHSKQPLLLGLYLLEHPLAAGTTEVVGDVTTGWTKKGVKMKRGEQSGAKKKGLKLRTKPHQGK